MTIPPTLMTLGYARTIAEIRLAIENRITNATNRVSFTPTYHRGTPDPNTLPDDTLGVWLDWVSIGPDPEGPLNGADIFRSEWRIYIVAKDEGQDGFGGQSTLAEQVWGDIVQTFTETNTDLGLDGSVDYTILPQASNFWGTISGGDRRVQAIEALLTCSHQMEWVRCP